MVVTKIGPQLKSKDRFNIFIDGEYLFSLTGNDLLKSGLAKGSEIDPAQLAELKKISAISLLQDASIRYLSYRPRSRKEIETYLKDKIRTKLPEIKSKEEKNVHISNIIIKLEQLGYVDDENFASTLVKHRTNTSKPKSKKAILYELQSKGISKDTANNVIDNIDDETELENAKSTADKLFNRLKSKNLDEKTLRQKISTQLYSKGFDWPTVSAAVDSLLPPTYN